jgi:hypothetical protein
MTTTPRRYQSYLIRLWRSDNDEAPNWHASTEDTMTGERKNFAGIKQLFSFLEQQTREHETGETRQSAPDG